MGRLEGWKVERLVGRLVGTLVGRFAWLEGLLELARHKPNVGLCRLM